MTPTQVFSILSRARKPDMGRIVVMNHVTLDGVMQGPSRADGDTRGGFAQGGCWLPGTPGAARSRTR